MTVGLVTSNISISLDGFVAGPNQSLENPIGEGGMRLHQWAFATESWQAEHGTAGGERNADSEVIEAVVADVGAYVMGRNMFSPGRGEWDLSWSGWWGDDPPYHVPVFVLTHFERGPVAMQGGTTFNFVTDGIESALRQAKAAAGDKSVEIPGGAETIRQYLRASLIDQLWLHIVPIRLGAGERLLENVGDPVLEPIEVIASPTVTHVKYRITGR